MRRARRGRQPARILPLAFLAAITVGTALLMLPASRTGPGHASFVDALFTSTSAVCVTGLVVVDTATYWSDFGQAVIVALIQVGGFGVMTLASLLGLLVSRRLGLQTRLVAAAETKTIGLGDVRRVLIGVAKVMFVCEAAVAVVLTLRFATAYDEPVGTAVWQGSFHAVSAFNNAGFSLFSNNLVGFETDAWLCLPIAAAVVVGGIGFPVLFELRRQWRRPDSWSTHTRLTVWTTAGLLALGFCSLAAFEWTNPRTLGALDVPGKLLASAFQAVQPRTAGFNTLDYSAMHEQTWTVTDALMFIGGGSAGTAGGIKVTTFALLGFVILAELRGDADVVIAHRRMAVPAMRQALTVALLGLGVVALGTLTLLMVTSFPLGRVLFEATSAFGTVGLSTGITPDLKEPARLVLVVLMFVGRVGTVTAASAMALRSTRRLYRMPESRPIVG